MKFRKICVLCIIFCISICIMTGCKKKEQKGEEENKKLNVVTTIYPYYDFVKHIAGDKVNLSAIVPAGEDMHSFEPNSTDMSHVLKADILIYNGGESEKWVDSLLKVKEKDARHIKRVSMMSNASVIVNSLYENGEIKKPEKTVEYDEHLWTAPLCAEKIVSIIEKSLSDNDKNNADYYRKNADKYKKELEQLDYEFREVVENGKTKHVIFADRFSLRYLAEELRLSYSAAYPTCGVYQAPKKQTVSYLKERIKEEKLPVIFKNEITKSNVAEKIAKKTGADVEVFNTCHTVSEKQFEDGVSYIDLMKKNVDILKKALK